MLKKDTEILIVQKYNDDFSSVIPKISKDSDNNILYTNCISLFTIDKICFKNEKFNSVFYSEDSNIMILFKKTENSNIESIKQKLTDNKIKFNEVNFEKNDSLFFDTLPPITIANTKKDLVSALKDTLVKFNSNKCSFYPLLNGKISLMYESKKLKDDDFDEFEEKKHEFDKIKIDGIITTLDKVILLTKNISENPDLDILSLIRDIGFTYYIYYNNNPKFLNDQESKIYVSKEKIKKKLNKRKKKY